MLGRNEMEDSDKNVLLKAAPRVAHNTMANLGQQPRHATAWAHLHRYTPIGREVGKTQERTRLPVRQVQSCQSCSTGSLATTMTGTGKLPRMGFRRTTLLHRRCSQHVNLLGEVRPRDLRNCRRVLRKCRGHNPLPLRSNNNVSLLEGHKRKSMPGSLRRKHSP